MYFASVSVLSMCLLMWTDICKMMKGTTHNVKSITPALQNKKYRNEVMHIDSEQERLHENSVEVDYSVIDFRSRIKIAHGRDGAGRRGHPDRMTYLFLSIFPPSSFFHPPAFTETAVNISFILALKRFMHFCHW